MDRTTMARTGRGGGSRAFNLGLGLIWGIPTGAVLGIAPMLGLILGAMAAVLLYRSAYRLWLAAGVLASTGATYLAALAYATARCREFAESSPFRDCRPPDDLAAYQIAGAVVLVIGVGLLAIAVAGAWRTSNR
jgi:hypothetical protein